MCRHDWKPLFDEPTEEATADVRADWMLMCLRRKQDEMVCRSCGARGGLSRGRRSTPGQKVIVYSQPLSDYGQEMDRQAEAWNQRVKETAR